MVVTVSDTNAPQVTVQPRLTRRWWLLLLAYPLLALAGALTHWQGFSLAAAMVLITVLMAPALTARRALAWVLWLASSAGMLLLAWRGLLGILLEFVPVIVSLLLAWLFGRSLAAGSKPLIARFIEMLEGPQRLQQPGVQRYARQLTRFWMLLLLTQAGVLLALLLLATPGGVLATLGLTVPWALPARWALGYVHLGGYALLAVTMLLEYPFRRWHLRHLAHPQLHHFITQLAARWPQLLHGKHKAAP
jgi:uncharacterized membrane protein